MTRKQIHKSWPPDFPSPDIGTLGRWLNHALHLGLVKRGGLGSKSDPYYF